MNLFKNPDLFLLLLALDSIEEAFPSVFTLGIYSVEFCEIDLRISLFIALDFLEDIVSASPFLDAPDGRFILN